MSKNFLPRELFRRVLGAEVVEVRVSRFALVQPVDVAPKMLAVAAYVATVSVRVRCREFRRTLMRALDFLRDDHHVPVPATTRVATRRVHAGGLPTRQRRRGRGYGFGMLIVQGWGRKPESRSLNLRRDARQPTQR